MEKLGGCHERFDVSDMFERNRTLELVPQGWCVGLRVWDQRTVVAQFQTLYSKTSEKVPEAGMKMYGSVEETETTINQANRCAWDYRFINEAMDL